MYKRILVPVDGSEVSTNALMAALDLARLSGSRIRVLHVLDEFAYLSVLDHGKELLDIVHEHGLRALQQAVDLVERAGIPCDSKLVDAPGQRLGECVAAEARSWEADLVVVGNHGRRGPSPLLLGCGAAQVVRCAPTPVLVHKTVEITTHSAVALPVRV